jgi:hypothetical protein
MAITTTGGNIHWNYFLALERDLETISRYIEFTDSNYRTHSIALAHLLLTTSSEVDTVAKMLCKKVNPEKKYSTINTYRNDVIFLIPEIANTQVFMHRYGLIFTPWEKWKHGENPAWWNDHQKVKHERDTNFNKATLQNAINSLGALLILTIHYYRISAQRQIGTKNALKDTTIDLKPESILLRYRGAGQLRNGAGPESNRKDAGRM